MGKINFSGLKETITIVMRLSSERAEKRNRQKQLTKPVSSILDFFPIFCLLRALIYSF